MTKRRTFASLPPRTGRAASILYIGVKNTSCMDYALPLMWKVKHEYPQSNLSVLHWFSDRRQVLRQSSYYSSLFKSLGIPEYDLIDFLKPSCAQLEGLFRWLFSGTLWDAPTLPFRKYLGSWRRGWKDGWAMWSDPKGFGRRVKSFVQRRLEPRLIREVMDLEHVLPTLDPDLVLLANHTVINFPGREYFYPYFEREQRPIVLLPHAPHNIGPVSFIPFDDRGPAMTDYCDYWVSFQYETPWKKACPGREAQFPIIGYPGLDSDWLDWMMSHDSLGQPRPFKAVATNMPLRCLFIIRKFLPSGYVRPPGYDPFTLDYDVFFDYLNLVREAIKEWGGEVDLIVKPHPSNNYPMVKEIFTASNIPRWCISHEPFYALLPDTDFVISLFSTSLLIPAMAGIPTIVLNSPLQGYVHRWDKLEQLYSGLQFFVEDLTDLSRYLGAASEIVRAQRRSGTRAQNPDAEHLRRFFPDRAIQRGIERLRHLLDRYPLS